MKTNINSLFSFIFSESVHDYDVVIFDVDSKDTSVGMSSPPQAFFGAKNISYSGPFPSLSFRSVRVKRVARI